MHDRLADVDFFECSHAQIDEDTAEYRRLLDAEAPEAEVHRFLASHVYFFNDIARHHVPIYSKVRLGADYEADFAFFEPSSFGVDWHLVEIERPGMQLCTRAGQITAELNHAIQQARDWRKWILDNRPYAQRTMPLVEHPFFYVFAGRRAALDENGRELLRYLNYENRLWLEIGTLDRFASGAQSAKALGAIQLGSYSYAEMARGQPTACFDWLRDPQTAQSKDLFEARLIEDRVRVDEDEVRAD